MGNEPSPDWPRKASPAFAPPCFVEGTLIDTPTGPVPIELLKKGELISTVAGPLPIRWVGNSKVRLDCENSESLRPVFLRAGSLGQGVPRLDVMLSQQHRVYLESYDNELLFGMNGVLVPAKFLVNERDIFIATSLLHVNYFHILVEGHQIVNANGLRAETLLLGEWIASNSSFQAQEEFRTIFQNYITAGSQSNYCASYPVLKKHEALVVCPD